MAPLRPIQIGNITIADPVILAPMTGVTDLPFRKMVRRYGSGLNVPEMIATQAPIRDPPAPTNKTDRAPSEEPVAQQLASCNPHETCERRRPNIDGAPTRTKHKPDN